MIKTKKLLGFILLTLTIWSCGSSPVIKRYFILDSANLNISIADSLKMSHPLPYAVKVEPFSISRSYNQDRIALRTRSNELQYYYENNWAEGPATAIRYFTWQQLKNAHLFERCFIQASDRDPDLLVTGAIHRIERMVRNDGHAAHVAMTLELVNLRSGKTLVSHHFDRELPLEDDARMNIFARLVSQILNEESTQFIHKILIHDWSE